MGREKKHHFVPASYLARFTANGSHEGKLWVFDLERSRDWESTPSGSALITDYNLIELEGVDPLLVEKDVFGTVESEAGPAFEELLGKAAQAVEQGIATISTTEETLYKLFVFMAAQTIRVPRIRDTLDDFRTEAMRQYARALASNEAAFEKAKSKYPEMSDVSLEEFRQFIATAELRSEGSPTSHLSVTLPTLFPVADLLWHRQWTLMVAPETGPTFIATDDPVTLIADEEHHALGVGFATRRSTIVFPLSRRVALHGGGLVEADRSAPLAVMSVNRQEASALNTSILRHSFSKVYAGEHDPACAFGDGHVGIRELLRRLRQSEDAEPAK